MGFHMILLLAALQEEIKHILHEMDVTEKTVLRPSTIFRGDYKGTEIILARTGIGLEPMSRTAEFCIREYKPDGCINIGYCGALTPNLGLADIVIANNIIDEDTGASHLPTLDNCGYVCETAGLKFFIGSLVTVTKPILTPHEKAYLGTKFDAIAVDMEAFALAKTAAKSKVPFAIVRSVLDTMDMHLPQYSGTLKADGTANPIGLAANIIKNPKEALSLPHLEFCATKATKAITTFVNELIKIHKE